MFVAYPQNGYATFNSNLVENLLITNAHIATPIGSKAVCGTAMNDIKEYTNAVIFCKNGKIAYVGSKENFDESLAKEAKIIDVSGRIVLPGFVDSHTHAVFGGYRPDEFEWRLKGDSYMSIMQRGGGIQSTVDHTRNASEKELIDKTRWFVNRMSEMGVTTVEMKSGYGLDEETEIRQLNVINTLAKELNRKSDIVSTFLGAHALPREWAKKGTTKYIDWLITEMLPQIKNLAKFCDIFCEKNVFELDDTRRLMLAAKELGFNLKIHADEIVTLGGAEVAAEVGAYSADHLLHISDIGISEMARAGVVATLLPLTAFALREPFAPARKMIESGCAVALATDLNPGSCFSGSIPLTIALACIYMNMSIQEVITALTLNGAAAVGMAEQKGSIEIGKDADFAILHFDNIRFMPYYVGMNCVQTTILRGKVVSHNEANP